VIRMALEHAPQQVDTPEQDAMLHARIGALRGA